MATAGFKLYTAKAKAFKIYKRKPLDLTLRNHN